MPAVPASRDLSNPINLSLDHAGWRDAEIRAAAYDRRRAQPNPDGSTTVFGNHGEYTVRPESGGYSCTCPAFGPCWHIALAQPLCRNCRADRAAVGFEHCRGCAEVLAERAADALRTHALLTAGLDVPESTPEEIAESWSVRAELLPSLLAQVPHPEPTPVLGFGSEGLAQACILAEHAQDELAGRRLLREALAAPVGTCTELAGPPPGWE